MLPGVVWPCAHASVPAKIWYVGTGNVFVMRWNAESAFHLAPLGERHPLGSSVSSLSQAWVGLSEPAEHYIEQHVVPPRARGSRLGHLPSLCAAALQLGLLALSRSPCRGIGRNRLAL